MFLKGGSCAEYTHVQADQTYMQAEQTCMRAVACREHIVATAIMEVLLLKCVCLDRRQRL